MTLDADLKEWVKHGHEVERRGGERERQRPIQRIGVVPRQQRPAAATLRHPARGGHRHPLQKIAIVADLDLVGSGQFLSRHGAIQSPGSPAGALLWRCTGSRCRLRTRMFRNSTSTEKAIAK